MGNYREKHGLPAFTHGIVGNTVSHLGREDIYICCRIGNTRIDQPYEMENGVSFK